MFYFRKEELRQFVGFLNDFRKNRPFVFYVLALGIAIGLGLALSVLLFPSTAAAIASSLGVSALANSPLYLAAVAIDQLFWNAVTFAILGNWLFRGDTWRSLNAFFHNLKQEQPILYQGIISTMMLSIASMIFSWFMPLAAPAYLTFAILLPAVIELVGLMTTLTVKSTVDAIQDGIFSDTQQASNGYHNASYPSQYRHSQQPSVYPHPAAAHYRSPVSSLYQRGQAADSSETVDDTSYYVYPAAPSPQL
jgi:hypothetical protein